MYYIVEFECKNHIFIKHMINPKHQNQFHLKCSSSKTLNQNPVTQSELEKTVYKANMTAWTGTTKKCYLFFK